MPATDPRVLSLSAEDRHRIETILADFQRGWAEGQLASKVRNLASLDENLQPTTLVGLIRVDLEQHWLSGNAVRLESYLKDYPELGTPETVAVELILAEYMAREAKGQAPEWQELTERFPTRVDEVRRLVEAVLGTLRNSSATQRSRTNNSALYTTGPEEHAALPEQFGRYRILKTLGTGGMGSVYLAHDTRLDRRVALKVPRFTPGSDPENQKRFAREARAAATINHPNLCPVFDVGEIDGRAYLTMAHIDGWPLSRFIKPGKRLPQFAVATLVRMVAYAIAEAHKHGVVHRDLKPTNIMINKRGEPIVMDFGLARWVDQDKEDTRLTRNGAILGAPVYMSPEQVYGDVEAMGPSCDVYSLGVILYELLTGHLPFEGPTAAVLAKTLIQPPKPPSAYREDLDPRLEAICLKALAKQIGDRFPTMTAMASALTDYIRAERKIQHGGPHQPAPDTAIEGTELPEPQLAPISEKRSAPPSVRRKTVPTRGAAETITTAAHEPTGELDEVDLLPAKERWLERPLYRRWEVLAGVGFLTLLMVGLAIGGVLYFARAATPTTPKITATGVVLVLNRFGDDVEMRVDGRLVDAPKAQVPLRLTPGPHSVVVTAPDYEPLTKEFFLHDNENQPIELTLKKKGGDPGVTIKPPVNPVPGVVSPHELPIRNVAVTSDGKYALTASDDFTLRLWDLDTQKPIRMFVGHTLPVTCCAVSPDGNRVVSGSGDGTVRVWDLTTAQELRRLDGHTDWVRAVAFSPDGRQVLSAGDDRDVRLWDLETQKTIAICKGHSDTVWSVAFSRDGHQALTASEDRTVRLWELDNAAELKRCVGHGAAVHSAVFGANGTRALSASDDSTMRVWDLEHAKEVQRFVGHVGKVRAAHYSSDEKRIVSCGYGNRDNTVRIWDATKASFLYHLGQHLGGVTQALFTPRDQWVLSVGEDHVLQRWDPQRRSTEPLPSAPSPLVPQFVDRRRFGAADHQMDRVSLSPDGKTALSAGYDGTVRLWDVQTGRHLRTFKGHAKNARFVAFSPDGTLAASCGEDKAVRIWNVVTGEQVKELLGHTANVWSCVWSPDGKQILSGGAGDHIARLWDVDKGEVVKQFRGHTKDINSVAISPDGSLAATASWDGTVQLWNPTTGALVRKYTLNSSTATVAFLPDSRHFVTGSADHLVRLWDVNSDTEVRRFVGQGESIYIVAVSPSGRRLASAGTDKFVYLWDVASGELLGKYEGHTDAITGAAFTPDGTEVLTASKDRSLILWDLPRLAYDPPPLPTGQVVNKEMRVLQGHTQTPERIAISMDGHRAISCGPDKTARVWDIAKGTEIASFTGHGAEVRAAVLSPDGTRAASVGNDKRLRLWEVDGAKEIRAYSVQDAALVCVAFDGEGKRLLTGADDGTIRLWNTASADEVKPLDAHTGAVTGVAFTPDGRFAVSAAKDQTIRKLDLGTGLEVARWSTPTEVLAFALSPDGRRVVTAGPDAKVSLWDISTRQQLAGFVGQGGTITSLTFSTDCRWVLSGGGDHTMRLWDVEASRERARFEAPGVVSVIMTPDGKQALSVGGDTVVRVWDLPAFAANLPVGELHVYQAGDKGLERVAISPDGRFALSAGYDNIIRLWNIDTGEEVKQLTGHTEGVRFVAFSPDGRQAVSASSDKTVRVWDLDKGSEVHKLEGHNSTAWVAVFSPDGQRIYSGAENGTCFAWNAATGEKLKTFATPRLRVNSLAVSPDGRLLATTCAAPDNRVYLWKTDSGDQVRRFEGHTDGTSTVAFSPNGRRLVSGSYDKTARLWDVATGECLHVFEGNSDQVWIVTFSPDGRRLAVAGGTKDKKLRLWDADTHTLLQVYERHTSGVTGAAFTLDGKRLLSSSQDSTLRLWGLPPR